MKRTDTPAVIVGAGINGLGVARSLARAKVPAWLLDDDAQLPAMATRAAKPVRIATLHGIGLVDELVRVASTRFAKSRPVLLLTQEDSVRVVSDHREQLAPFYCFSLPPADVVHALQHKHAFQRLAEQFDCPIPPLVRVAAMEDLPKLELMRYPVVVKPGERNDGYGRQFKKAYRVETAAEAAELVRRILPVMPDVVVQEWTEGPDSNIYFCLQYINAEGNAAASFTGRKIRSWPPQVGGTASCAPAPEAHAELSALTERFFRSAGAIGMAAMEYKRDVRSGEFRMVEPTIGRTDYQAEVATLNGVNLPYAAYCAELALPSRSVHSNLERSALDRHSREGGNPATLVRHHESRRHRIMDVATRFRDDEQDQRIAKARVRKIAWRVRSEDAQSALAQQQRPDDGFAEFDDVVDALWRASDPWPWLAGNWQRVRRALSARVTKTGRDSQPVGSKP